MKSSLFSSHSLTHSVIRRGGAWTTVGSQVLHKLGYCAVISSKLNNEKFPTVGAHSRLYTNWWLTYPSEKYESQLGWFFPIYGKMKNVPNHQLAPTNQLLWLCLMLLAIVPLPLYRKERCNGQTLWKTAWGTKTTWGTKAATHNSDQMCTCGMRSRAIRGLATVLPQV